MSAVCALYLRDHGAHRHTAVGIWRTKSLTRAALPRYASQICRIRHQVLQPALAVRQPAPQPTSSGQNTQMLHRGSARHKSQHASPDSYMVLRAKAL